MKIYYPKFLLLGIIGTCFVLFLFVNDTFAAGVNWYVRVDGDDTNCNGLVDAAYPGVGGPGLACAHKTIQKAHNSMAVDDIVNVGAGTFSQNLSITKKIEMRGAKYGQDARTRDTSSGETIIKASGVGTVLTFSGTARLIADGFTVDGSPLDVGANSVWGFYTTGNTVGFELRNNYIKNVTTPFILHMNSASSPVRSYVENNFVKDITKTTAALSGDGIYSQGLNNVEIKNNKFTDLGYSAMVLATGTHKNSSFNHNEVYRTQEQGIQAAGTCSNIDFSYNYIEQANLINDPLKGAIRIYGATFNGPVTIQHNTLVNSFNGFAVKDGENITGKDITVSDNTFTGNVNKAINHAGTGALNATNNWFGTNVASEIISQISGQAYYQPYYTDAGMTTTSSLPSTVYVNTSYTSGSAGSHSYWYDAFNNLPDAIANTASGGTILVDPGEYTNTSQIVVNKALTIKGSDASNRAKVTINIVDTNVDGVVLKESNINLENLWFYRSTTSSNSIILSIPKTGTFPNYTISYNNILIKNCLFESGRRAIYGAAQNLTLDGNIFKDQLRDSVFLDGYKGTINIKNNNFTGAAGTSKAILVESGSGQPYAEGTLNIEYNNSNGKTNFFVFNHWGDVSKKTEIIINHNSIDNASSSAIAFYAPTDFTKFNSAEIKNNIFSNLAKRAVLIDYTAADQSVAGNGLINVHNNLYFNNNLGGNVTDITDVTGNLAYSNLGPVGATITMFNSASNITGDPLYQDQTHANYNYNLSAGSPAIGMADDGRSIGYWQEPVKVQFTGTSSSNDENVGSINIAVSLLSVSDQDISVQYSVSGGSATGGSDYNLTSGTINILHGSTTANIGLTVINDSDYESDETIEISLNSPINAILGTNTLYTYTIKNDDQQPGGSSLPAIAFVKPIGSYQMIINNGDADTQSKEVVIKFINIGDDIKKIAISNTQDFTYSSQQDYSSNINWKILGNEGLNKIYAKLFNVWGQSTEVIEGSINFDDKTSRSGQILKPQDVNLTQNEVLPIDSIKLELKPVFQTKPIVQDKILSLKNSSKVLKTYIQLGRYYDKNEVKKLQIFLKENQGIRNIKVNGIYDSSTRKAVIKFQEKYSYDILRPWGIKKGTGIIGKYTLSKINSLIK